MASFGFDPFSAFQVGQQIGQARSPVSGLGTAIRNILDDARKRGLIQAQAQYQGQEAMDLATYKQGLESAYNEEEIPLVTVGPGGRVDDSRRVQRGAKVVTEPSMQLSPLAEAMQMAKEAAAMRGQQGGSPFPSEGEPDANVSATLSSKATQFLKENGAPITAANIKAVIDRGLVK